MYIQYYYPFTEETKTVFINNPDNLELFRNGFEVATFKKLK